MAGDHTDTCKTDISGNGSYCAHVKTKLLCADVYLEVSESDVPVSGRVSVGAGH